MPFCNEDDRFHVINNEMKTPYTTGSTIKINCNLNHEMSLKKSSRDIKCGDDGWEDADLTDCYRGDV